MLAQIKSSDEDVWRSLRRSGHFQGEPSNSLVVRLARMRNWIDGAHFPIDAKIEIKKRIGDEARENLGVEGRKFLSSLSSLLSGCEWSDEGINAAIVNACESTGTPRGSGYSALYWALIGRSNGPKASSLLSEMDREGVLSLLGSA